MSKRQEIFSLTGDIIGNLHPFYQERVTKWFRDSGIAAPNWYTLTFFRALDPKPLTALDVQTWAPFTSLSLLTNRLKELAEEGYLVESGADSYRLAERGVEIAEGFFTRAHENLEDVKPLPEDELARLENFLARLVNATTGSSEPEDKPALESSLWTTPGEDASSMALIDQYATDLLRFRDDAHNAAWQKYDLDGRIWEAFTNIWRERAKNAAELAERLALRGFSEAEYSDALDELTALGWLESEDGQYQASSAGKKVRQEAEDETDRIFYNSWTVLNDEELDQLHDLLTRANDNLREAGKGKMWAMVTDLSGAIYAATREVVEEPFKEHFENPASFQPLMLTIGNSPEPLTVADYGKRAPYTNPSRGAELLASTAEGGYLSNGSNDQYMITAEGQAAIDTVNDIFYSYLSQVEPLPLEDLERLAGFLDRLVQACLEAEEPAVKWALKNTNNSHPEKDYAPLAKIDQLIDDLNAYRDDSHVAAWRGLGIGGRTWETFSYVWREQATTSAELIEKLPFRGYTEEDYATSLAELVNLGWLEATADAFQMSEKGLEIREEAERKTNQLFFEPWSSLSNGEQGQLRNLLVRLKLGLQEITEEPQTATP